MGDATARECAAFYGAARLKAGALQKKAPVFESRYYKKKEGSPGPRNRTY
jgi:hypothetical protein